MRIQYLLMVLFAVCAVTLSGCGKPESATQPLRVGVMFPMSGDAASYGEKGQRAVQMALDEVNATGINSRKIQMILDDSKADPATAVTVARKLISVDRVPIIIADIVSSTTLAIAPIAEKSHVVVLAPTASAPAITDAGEFIYRIWPSDSREGQAIADLALQKGLHRVGIIHMKNDYGTAIAQIFKRTFEGGGGKVVALDSYLQNNEDFRGYLTKIADAKPDTLYVAGYFADTAKVLRQAKELGLQITFLGTTAVEDDKFLELAQGAAEGLIYPVATGFDVASTSPKVRQFVDAFRKRFQYEPGWVEAQCYDAFMLYCAAVANIHGTVTGESIKRVFDSMGPYNGVTGTFQFDAKGDVVKPVVLKTVKDGKFAVLVQ